MNEPTVSITKQCGSQVIKSDFLAARTETHRGLHKMLWTLKDAEGRRKAGIEVAIALCENVLYNDQFPGSQSRHMNKLLTLRNPL